MAVATGVVMWVPDTNLAMSGALKYCIRLKSPKLQKEAEKLNDIIATPAKGVHNCVNKICQFCVPAQ